MKWTRIKAIRHPSRASHYFRIATENLRNHHTTHDSEHVPKGYITFRQKKTHRSPLPSSNSRPHKKSIEHTTYVRSIEIVQHFERLICTTDGSLPRSNRHTSVWPRVGANFSGDARKWRQEFCTAKYNDNGTSVPITTKTCDSMCHLRITYRTRRRIGSKKETYLGQSFCWIL